MVSNQENGCVPSEYMLWILLWMTATSKSAVYNDPYTDDYHSSDASVPHQTSVE